MKYFLPPDAASLPAAGIADEVNRALAGEGCIIVTAPPGAGKSTLLPLTMLDALPEGSRILMLEPRRLAARQIALRMAALLGEPVGKTVGYRIRFESRVSPSTRIEVLTEGILTRRLVDDPGLEGVAAVIFDEFHERSLAADVALALTREAQVLLRPDLRIVLMSATIDTEGIRCALSAPVIAGEGRMFPVEILHSQEEADASHAPVLVARTIRKAHQEREGDILAFLPGEAEIRRCAELLGTSLGDTQVRPLYGMLSPQEQRAAIQPDGTGRRRVVLATPVAETSLTIEGVRIVVDAGLCRKQVFDARTALSHLETVRIGLDQADQRSGRAGRQAPGVCYRLWSLATEQRMAPVRTPEILEADLASTVLDIAAWGENRLERLPWLTPPPAARVAQARQLLESLGAVDGEGRVTAHGRALAALPCHPRMGQMLLKAMTSREKSLAADVAALLEEKDPSGMLQEAGIDIRIRRLREARRSGQAGRWSQVLRVARQYCALAGVEPGLDSFDPYEIGALLAAAFPERIGRAWHEGAGRFLLSSGDVAAVDPSDVLASCGWVSVASVHVRKDGVGRIFLAAPVDVHDLQGLARTRKVIHWDSRQGAVIARQETRIGSLLLEVRPLSEGVRAEMTQVICEAARKEGLSMLDFSDDVQDFQRRVAAVAAWHPELELPDLGTGAVLQRAPEWLPPCIGRAVTVADLKKIDLAGALRGLLTYAQQQAVDRMAPTHITVPTGSRIRVEYRPGADTPVVRVRLQECFGLVDTPRVDDGRRPVLMELLSPGYKPVQLTSDLHSFWTKTYFEVRKELRRRYPRHAWPDDPIGAEAVRGVRRSGKE